MVVFELDNDAYCNMYCLHSYI